MPKNNCNNTNSTSTYFSGALCNCGRLFVGKSTKVALEKRLHQKKCDKGFAYGEVRDKALASHLSSTSKDVCEYRMGDSCEETQNKKWATIEKL